MSLESCTSPDDLLRFIGNLAQDDVHGPSQFGSFTPSIYDSAWMSMVYKNQNSEQGWMFPQCFQYVLSLQQPDGAWPGFSSLVDGILSTAASLLALLNRRERTLRENDQGDISQRIERAIKGLQNLLQGWDVAESDQVGFELIVPSTLCRIAQYGVHFQLSRSEISGYDTCQKDAENFIHGCYFQTCKRQCFILWKPLWVLSISIC